MNQKILLAEDDPNLGELLKDYLELKGKFDVVLCTDGQEGMDAFRKEEFDLCILDVMMPKKDGFSLGKDIRKINQTVPIIYATAKGMMEDKTQAFELGGDDYITKPFRVEELLLRINALLKRASKDKEEEVSDKFEIGDYFFDYTSQIISYKGQQQKLSTKEAELLRLLCLKKNDVLTREEALIKIWHDDNYFTGRSMDVFLSKLRKYLKEDPNVEIVNVHGKGYKLLVS
ncbi:DNA-binding response regulator [Sphingobacterium mizutaii NBRC 14946 = DSM 11724]|jgi:DNA-binding response OmpR family regulator|uniref:Sensory transduction protein regX3 n=4 Tax=Sphingobacterium TaxID=28453 RepID=A0AAJ4XE32_9SPHI|nr:MULTISPECIES: response regulator transcription factor [Sphingobacterium]MBV2226321.1 response regulator transcription factor [Sphingobacterium mizutaii]MCT1531239.1 response regulator transcription factor [Sphingobacterium daejeonense]SDL68588.1 DNA-binding response regulator, OmpR family, contains REC and winged-helix (wHTH) domain [Sphingobacterium mizutaii]SNV58220.1 Sensory transduction protein regX3 [Sphingobacterium mizutaii]VTQ05605.1 Sensory transduction protein regX3 [Sphingobacter